ncbi:MAG: hypothetical protein NTV81_02235 [Candidatus Komeilibacteria bacterium]|nr:hypothetical protein [Candidatus Komeilibacteria bacterium]
MKLKLILLASICLLTVLPALGQQHPKKIVPPPDPSVVTITKSQWIQVEQKNVVYKGSTSSKVAGAAAGAALGYYLKRTNPVIWGATAVFGWMAGDAASKKPVQQTTWLELSRVTLSNGDTLTVLGHLLKGAPVDPDTLAAVIIKTD